MWDLKGQRQFERRSNAQHQATVSDAQWEASTDLLATVFENGKWAVVRIGSDGSPEYAVPPVAGEDVENPFTLTLGGMSYGD